MQNLSHGSQGQSVKSVQHALNAKGFACGKADGIFGNKTYQAVVNFQHMNGLTADGIVGPKTFAALGL